KGRRVVVGRPDQADDELVLDDLLAADGGVLGGDAHEAHMDRRLEAEQLLDRAADEVGVLPELAELVGRLAQGQRADADEVGVVSVPAPSRVTAKLTSSSSSRRPSWSSAWTMAVR